MEKEDSALSRRFSDPLEFLLAVMNDPAAPLGDRLDAAATLMPYFHEPLAGLSEDE